MIKERDMGIKDMTIKKCVAPERVNINHLIYDVLIIKAESLNDDKIFSYANYLEKQLLSIKKGEKVLEL